LVDGAADTAVNEIVTDSRVAGAGDLFVALKGPRFDAHEFVGAVLAKGAAAIVARETSRGPAIVVADTLEALQQLAHAIRSAVATRVVAITGSAGKTTTKETIAEFLSGKFRVVKNKGNLNNHIGLPLSLMQLRSEPDVAVMELGMNHAGEISTLVAIAEPDVRVWTNVGDAHIGFFASPDAIADAKAEILERADPDDVLVCNADDERIMRRATKFPGRIVTFGEAAGATVRAVKVENLGLNGMRAHITTPGGDAAVSTALLGRGNLGNVLAAIAVALEFGLTLAESVERTRQLRAAARRGVVHRLRGDVLLVDDSYNSSPSALKRSLEMLGHERSRRKVVVLGEMLELGAHAIALHAASGEAVAQAGVNQLLTVGGEAAKAMAAAAVASGIPATAARHFERSGDAADAVVPDLRDGDVVLVKGSRGIRTDVVVDRILAERG
jgi:UDP-N-acetylmuramoyl-tripeptide--D-alanyl-D-alanine ligase